MALKPASGTALDTGGAFYSGLAAVWAMLEGSGGTSADSKGSRTLTLDAAATWSTDGAGDPIIAIGSAVATPLALASSLGLVNTNQWSVAWRAKQTTSNNQGVIAGSTNGGGDLIWYVGGTELAYENSGGTAFAFTGETLFTSDHNWLLTFDQAVGAHLYKDGTEISGSPKAGVNGGTLTITKLGGGFNSTGLTLIGTMTYLYVWNTRLLSGAEAATLSSNPYTIFQSGSPGVAAPQSLLHAQSIRRASSY